MRCSYMARRPVLPCATNRAEGKGGCGVLCPPSIASHLISPLTPPHRPPPCSFPLQVTRRLILFGYPSDAKSLQPVAAVNQCAPAMSEVLTQLLALKQAAAAAGSGGQAARGGQVTR